MFLIALVALVFSGWFAYLGASDFRSHKHGWSWRTLTEDGLICVGALCSFVTALRALF